MTNAELIEKIRAEIERRIKVIKPQKGQGFILCEQLTKQLQGLLSFLSTLESEKPIEGIEGLEVASVELADMLLAKQKDYAISAKADYWNGAHDGVIAGAFWRALNGPIPLSPEHIYGSFTLEIEEPCEELEEEVKRYYSDNFDYISSDQPTLSILTNIARHFAKWGAEHAKK